MNKRLERLIAKHSDALEAIARDLAMNFEAPAQRLINAGFAQMGVSRFTQSGDDLWEMYASHKNGWEYIKPARHLVNRWAAY